MLLNDVTRNDKMNEVHTRDLQNAVVRHHENNPHISGEAAFEYIMSISSTYRALPTACIEKARRHLALPTIGIKPKQVTSEYKPSLFLVTQDEITPIGWMHTTIPVFDSRVAIELMSSQVESSPSYPGEKSMVKPKSKPGTTVVHTERVVVDGKKMIKILNITGLRKRKDLPIEYVKGAPSFTEGLLPDKVLFIYSTEQSGYRIDYGDALTVEEFEQIIKTMKEAAARLAEINKTAKLEKEHSGKFMVSI